MIRRMIRRLRPCLSPELIKGRGHSSVVGGDFIFKECVSFSRGPQVFLTKVRPWLIASKITY